MKLTKSEKRILNWAIKQPGYQVRGRILAYVTKNIVPLTWQACLEMDEDRILFLASYKNVLNWTTHKSGTPIWLIPFTSRGDLNRVEFAWKKIAPGPLGYYIETLSHLIDHIEEVVRQNWHLITDPYVIEFWTKWLAKQDSRR